MRSSRHSGGWGQISLHTRATVVVVGGGSSGICAAIASARAGADTLLLERYGFLGGISTGVLDTFYGFYTPGSRPIKVVGGVADHVVAALQEYNACFERPNTYGAGTGITYHPDYLKVIWDRLLLGSGARVLLHSWVQGVILAGERIAGLVVATKQGLLRIDADYVIDASGDADVCHFCDVPYELAGEKEPAQSLTTTFRVGNVDLERRMRVSKEEFHRLMAEAADSGHYHLPRREGSDHRTPVSGVTATNMTRVQSFEMREGRVVNASDPELLTRAEIEGRKQAVEYLRFLRDCVPGYERAELIALSTQIGVRETRRIHGTYRLTREDVLSARQFDDQIGLCGAPIEDHHSGSSTKWQYLPDGECVGIPFRTLLPRGPGNLIVTGRCFSADHDAHASVRSMGQCMAMGQAAGTAAAMAARQRVGFQEIDVARLCQSLRESGAILESGKT